MSTRFFLSFRSLLRSGCCLLVASSLFLSTSRAQTAPTWQATYDGVSQADDLATSVTVLPSGNVAVAGSSQLQVQPGLYVSQFLTTLYSPQGQVIWTRTHGSGLQSDGFAQRIAVTQAGKIVVAGTRNAGGEWMVVQYDAAGTLEWEGIYPAASTFVSFIADMDVDPLGNVYVCGDVSAGATLVKFVPTGGLQWSRTYVPTNQEFTSVRGSAINASGEVFLTGNTTSPAGALQFAIARVDPGNGNPTWIRNHGPAAAGMFSLGQVVETDAAGRVIAGGLLTDPTGTNMFPSLISYQPDGTLTWQYDHTTATAFLGSFEDITVGASGALVAVGWAISPLGNVDGYVIRLSGSSFAWDRLLTGSAQSEDRAMAVALDPQGNAYVGAYLQDPDLGFDAFCFGPQGSLLAHGRASIPTQGSGFTRDLAVGPQGRAYVVGDMRLTPGAYSDAITTAFDFGSALGNLFCAGDGSGAACPCGNNGSSGNGCASSMFVSGAGLASSGSAGASTSTDTLVLTATNLPGPGLFFQGDGTFGAGSGTAFGDGLLCAGGAIVRLGVVFPTSGTASYPGGSTPVPVHVAGSVNAGDVRHYQCWYRDAAVFCSSATFNLTQGWTLNWGP